MHAAVQRDPFKRRKSESGALSLRYRSRPSRARTGRVTDDSRSMSEDHRGSAALWVRRIRKVASGDGFDEHSVAIQYISFGRIWFWSYSKWGARSALISSVSKMILRRNELRPLREPRCCHFRHICVFKPSWTAGRGRKPISRPSATDCHCDWTSSTCASSLDGNLVCWQPGRTQPKHDVGRCERWK